MTGELYLVCHDCKSVVYACKNEIISDSDDLPQFIEYHQFRCDGKMEVWGESSISDVFDYVSIKKLLKT
jgi:hypothetical protein